MSDLGVAVWGAGWVSGEHVKAWEAVPGCKVVAVGSRKEESARRVAATSGVPDADIYADERKPLRAYEKILERSDVQVVSICTPNDLHATEGILGAEAKKHLVVEKPIAITLKELRALRDAVRKNKVKTVVSFVLRWNPLFDHIKSLTAAGALGKIFYGEVDYWHYIDTWWTGWVWAHTKASGGSAFLTGGCHAVDAIRWLVGSEVVSVSAYASQWDTRFEYPPTVVASLQFANGAVGKTSTTFECRMPYNFNIDLLGDKGTFRYNGDRALLWSETLNPGQKGWTILNTINPDSGDVEHHPFKGEMAHFAECIRSNVESHCNVEDAYKTHEVCLAIDKSAATGKSVKLPLP